MGDIEHGNVLSTFFDHVCDAYDHVLFIPGNHEFYRPNYTMKNTLDWLDEQEHKHKPI